MPDRHKLKSDFGRYCPKAFTLDSLARILARSIRVDRFGTKPRFTMDDTFVPDSTLSQLMLTSTWHDFSSRIQKRTIDHPPKLDQYIF